MVPNKFIKQLFVFTLTSISFLANAQAPTKYWVRFKDKTGSPYSITTPSVYLTAKSISRRTTKGIAIDMTDIPVNQSYINLVNATGATVFQRSKWMNAAIVIITSPSQLAAVNALTCVLGSTPVGRFKRVITDEITNKPKSSLNYLQHQLVIIMVHLLLKQIKLVQIVCITLDLEGKI